MWTFDDELKRMVLREVTYVPGFYKIMDEILVNAADNKVRNLLELHIERSLFLRRLMIPIWTPLK